MDNQMKLGAVLIGGYLLGRTKKGGMALRLATRMALSGTDANPRELVQDNAVRLLQSDVIQQLREQMTEVAKAAIDARMQGLTQALTDRTEVLKNPAGQVTDQLTKDDQEEDQDDEQGDQEDQEAEEQAEEPEGADEGAEEDDQREGEGDQDGDDSDPEEEIRARATELRRKRISTLRKMANDLFEGEEDEIESASKSDLARWIAEAEAEDEDEEDD